MCQMNVLEAKTNFSRIIKILEDGVEEEVVVARSGKPVVRITLIPQVDVSKRIGICKGMFTAPDNIDEMNDEIAEMFGV